MEYQLDQKCYLTMDEVKAHLDIGGEKDAKKTAAEIKRTELKLAMLMNMACQKVETHIQGPVLVQEKTDIQDGTAANSLVPHFYPVRKINLVKIDFNGDFDQPTSEIDEKYYSIRGYWRDIKFGISGSDIIVRNDGNTSIIGRLFIGSVVQSILVKYEAGLAYDPSEVPADLKYATLMLVEYFYLLRENRDLNITSKTNVGGQSYGRTSGNAIPAEIEAMLEPYVDYTFGAANKPQKNNFSI